MDLDYRRTLIAVADDCPVSSAVVPTSRTGKPTVATVQHELIANAPYRLTQPDVLFESWLRRQPDRGELSPAEVTRLREEFFSRPQACLRASPLPKTYGWGLLFDEAGRVALCPVGSDEYRRLVSGDEVTVVKAMRSRRS